MRINKFYAVAIAAATLLASCSKDKPETDTGEKCNVTVKIERPSSDTPDTRAIGDPIVAGGSGSAKVEFSGGYLVFTNKNDVITLVITVSNDVADYVEGTSVGINKLDAGVTITGVPGNSVGVYFLGNVTTKPVAGNPLGSYTENVTTQLDTGYGKVYHVSLYGGNTLSPVPTETGKYTATFNVAPIGARFEIASIQGTATNNGVLEYKVAGIFIDNYYHEMSWTGVPTDNALKYNSNHADYYADNATSTASSYLTAVKQYVYDYNELGLANQTSFTPGTGKVWAYNLFAPTTSSPAMPAIVIKLTDVTVNGVSHGTQFLTISKFFTDSNKTNSITKLEQSHIYVLSNIAFDENAMTTDPYTKSIEATVNITMLQWESSNVGWEF
jgi:hypothetical protein